MAQDASKPNIILIMADDLGWGDVGFNGNTRIQTPCLDRLSSEGVIFDQFYSSAPLSSPTRASVLTGRNAYRMGVFAPNVGILRPEEKTLPKLLKEKGYTFYIDSPTNQQFVVLENRKMEELKKDVQFSFWEKKDDTHTVVRFATSWATRMEDVHKLLTLL